MTDIQVQVPEGTHILLLHCPPEANARDCAELADMLATRAKEAAERGGFFTVALTEGFDLRWLEAERSGGSDAG